MKREEKRAAKAVWHHRDCGDRESDVRQAVGCWINRLLGPQKLRLRRRLRESGHVAVFENCAPRQGREQANAHRRRLEPHSVGSREREQRGRTGKRALSDKLSGKEKLRQVVG